MNNIFDNMGNYGAQWGVTDFYSRHEEKLRAALDSGKDFLASWGVKKEIEYGSVRRENGKITISFITYVDEIHDAVDTLIWGAVGGNAVCDSGFDWVCEFHNLDPRNDDDSYKANEIMEEMQVWVEDIYQEESSGVETLPADSTYDQIVEALDALSDKVKAEETARWEEMKEAIKIGIDSAAEEARQPR